MILFNWFCVGLVLMLVLIAMQIRRMAHRTPIFTAYAARLRTGGPTLFLVANIFWLPPFRPEFSLELTQMFNDLAWITFTSQVPFSSRRVRSAGPGDLLRRPAPAGVAAVVAYFNLSSRPPPRVFVALTLSGPVAWDGVLSFWLKNTRSRRDRRDGAVLGQAIRRERRAG